MINMGEVQTTSELIKKELGIEKLASASKEAIIGNLKIEQIIKIADLKKDDIGAKLFKDNVKVIAGVCMSCGILIEGKSPVEVIDEINKGTYDDKINSKVTTLSSEEVQKQKDETKKYKESLEKMKARKDEEQMQKKESAKK
ncbi:MAG: hypothetical protein DRN66_04020 [Candidatus Nanohalarchaeota archaeon]|nr:MAG: hypothetical protein DRN66_04020 [Candidatus Nanohaloarchaeota archaeon]